MFFTTTDLHLPLPAVHGGPFPQEDNFKECLRPQWNRGHKQVLFCGQKSFLSLTRYQSFILIPYWCLTRKNVNPLQQTTKLWMLEEMKKRRGIHPLLANIVKSTIVVARVPTKSRQCNRIKTGLHPRKPTSGFKTGQDWPWK